jgi:hypothetical protein
VVVIDEVDRLFDNGPGAAALLRVVDWLSLPACGIRLITMANSMHQPEQKTRSRLNTTQRVVFQPYTAQELQEILAARLQHIRPVVFQQNAAEGLCRQIANSNGDVRRLLQTAAAALHGILRAHAEDGVPLPKLPPPSATAKGTAGAAAAAPQQGFVQFANIFPTIRRVLYDRMADLFESNALAPLHVLALAALAHEVATRESASSAGSGGGVGGGGGGAGAMVAAAESAVVPLGAWRAAVHAILASVPEEAQLLPGCLNAPLGVACGDWYECVSTLQALAVVQVVCRRTDTSGSSSGSMASSAAAAAAAFQGGAGFGGGGSSSVLVGGFGGVGGSGGGGATVAVPLSLATWGDAAVGAGAAQGGEVAATLLHAHASIRTQCMLKYPLLFRAVFGGK